MNDIAIHERDVWIVEFIRSRENGSASIREIWEAARHPRKPVVSTTDEMVVERGGLGETASLPTYHRTVRKLVARGYLGRASDRDVESSDGDEAARYIVLPQVSALTALSQPDLNELLLERGPAEALARYAVEVDRFEEQGARILAEAGRRLMHEDPRDLVFRMLVEKASEFDQDLAELRDEETAEPQHRSRVERKLAEFGRLVHGQFGINPAVWYVPTLEEALKKGLSIEPPDANALKKEIAFHVFGEAFLERVIVPDEGADGLPPLHVAGTDGSSHFGVVRGMPAAAYLDEERTILTFNNSAGFVDLSGKVGFKYPSPFHGVPVSRAALEDPGNRGMILSPAWYDDLSDGEFEHLKKVAQDVVQYRIDEQLFSGEALPYGTHPVLGGPALPAPHVLIRDGTVTPQARELQNYERPNAYGEMVREGIRRSYKILRMVMDSQRRVYAGAVKTTQLQTFSEVLNWYISQGSRSGPQPAIDPTWNRSRPIVPDAYAMTRLLQSLPSVSRTAEIYRTCVIVRPFPAMVTSLYRHDNVRDPREWLDFFRERAADQERHRRPGENPWWAGRDVSEDAYARLCVYGDYGMFFFGRPGGAPHLLFPRFEFLDSLRTLEPERRSLRVLDATMLIMRGVRYTKWSLDREHNIFTDKKLPKLVPFVVSEAHEKSKVLGHKLVSELQQDIAARVIRLKSGRPVEVANATVEPVPLTRALEYIEKMAENIPAGESVGDAQADTVASAEEARLELQERKLQEGTEG